jgi:glutamate--cysteine ligase
VGGITCTTSPREVLDIAEAGLKARARPGLAAWCRTRRHFLHALRKASRPGKVPGRRIARALHGDWNGDLSRIYAEYSY